MTDERLKTVRALVELSQPLNALKARLNSLEWDYKGTPVELRADQLLKVLQLFVDGKISAADVETWADLIECREDIAYETGAKEWLDEVITELANPSMSVPFTVKRAKILMLRT